MRGHIRKRPNGSYAVVIDEGDQPARHCADESPCKRVRVWVKDDPKAETCPRCGGPLAPPQIERRQRWSTYKLRKDAERALTSILRKLDQGVDAFPVEVLTRVYLGDWLVRHSAYVRPQTHRRYGELVENVISLIGDIPLQKLRAIDVQRALDAMAANGLSASTVVQSRAVLNRAFTEAVRSEVLARNVIASTTVPRPGDPGLAVLLPEHVTALLTAAKGTRWELPLTLSAWTGARRSEVLALRWADMDLVAGIVTINRTLQIIPKVLGGGLEFAEPKTARSRRTIKLTPTLVTVLKAHRVEQAKRRLLLGEEWDDGDLLVEDGAGLPIHPDALTAAFRRLAKKAGLPKGSRLHDLRHAVAVLLALEKVPLEAVSAILGHASPGFTLSVYRHVVDEMTEQAAEALERRLGSAFAGRLQDEGS